MKTIIGWVISGYCESPSQAVTAHTCCQVENSSKTDELLHDFIESEEPPSDAQNLSPDEQLAVTHFQDTIVETLMDATLLHSHLKNLHLHSVSLDQGQLNDLSKTNGSC